MLYLMIALGVIFTGAIGSTITAATIQHRWFKAERHLDDLRPHLRQKSIWLWVIYRVGAFILRAQAARYIGRQFRTLYRLITYFPLKGYHARKVEEAREAAELARLERQEQRRVEQEHEAAYQAQCAADLQHARDNRTWKKYRDNVWVLEGNRPDGSRVVFIRMQGTSLGKGLYMLEYIDYNDASIRLDLEETAVGTAEGLMTGDLEWLQRTQQQIVDAGLTRAGYQIWHWDSSDRHGELAFMSQQPSYHRLGRICGPRGTSIGIGRKEPAYPDDRRLFWLVANWADGEPMPLFLSKEEVPQAIVNALEGLQYGMPPRYGLWQFVESEVKEDAPS